MADGAPVQAKTVFLGLPHSGSMVPEAMVTIGVASRGVHAVQISSEGSSLLAFNFNRLWATALNLTPRPEFFAMCHSDIGAPEGWLDTLLATLERERATMVSAVVPLKDGQGLTSTAVIDLEQSRRRRLTIGDVMALPEVFDAKLAGRAVGLERPERSVLAVNTGLWVCRFRGEPWIDELHFHTGDDIRRDAAGRFYAHVFPEDWLWSAELAARGLKVVASRELAVTHYGKAGFSIGGGVWGSLEADAWIPM